MRHPANGIDTDVFMQPFIEPLYRNLRLHVVVKLVSPYKRVLLTRLAAEVNTDVKGLEILAVELITTVQLDAKIDQANGIMVMGNTFASNDASCKILTALKGWETKLEGLTSTITDCFSARLHATVSNRENTTL